MRYLILLTLAICFSTSTSFAQIYTPVKWDTDYKQVNETEFDLIFTATIDKDWSVYSQYLENDDGPVRTSISIDKGDHFTFIGKNKETGHRKEGFDKLFDMNVIKFTDKMVCTQRVKVSDLSKPIIGYLEYMTCDATKCLPPDQVDFEFKLKSTISAPTKNTGAVEKIDKKKETKIAESKSNKEKAKTTKKEKQKLAEEKKQSKVSTDNKKTSISLKEETKTKPSNPGILEPVKWQMDIAKVNEKEYDLTFTANMDKGWSIYSQFTEEGGPEPTSFTFDEAAHFSLLGKTKEEGHKKEGPDPLFDGINVSKFIDGKVTFTQRIKTEDASKAISGYLMFMTCDNKMCLPPTDVTFYTDLSKSIALVGTEAENALEGSTNDIVTSAIGSGLYGNLDKASMKNPVSVCGNVVEEKSKSIWGIFVLGLIGGFLALLTPCVFPMIPLTVSFFTKGSSDKKKGLQNAFLYGFFIFLVYIVLSIPFHLMDSLNPDILNDISTNVWLNLAFFAIFIFFAFSFFGYYEISMPSSFTNKVSSAEGVGGIVGIFFMALTLALVSFSCTGPILGALLAGALTSDGGAWQLSAGMGGFGVALALPFALFAAFPGWMNSLPKSGGWLTTVKVVLGFLELALAFKFLSNADLVSHWGLLKIEPFLIIWILCGLGLAAYLFGFIKFPHDPPKVKLGVGRVVTALASLAFVIYLASGFIYNEKSGSLKSLSLLSGLAPPTCYSWFYPCDCPQNFNCFKDFDEGLAYAKKVNKPIMVDFTGYACVNCRKMEEHVWPIKRISDYIANDYVLISLYVDDKKELPEADQITVEKATGGTRKLRNYGHKWAHFQTEYFGINAQPYYVLLSPDGKLLNTPVGYTPDDKDYDAFLKCGLNAYKELKLIGQKK